MPQWLLGARQVPPARRHVPVRAWLGGPRVRAAGGMPGDAWPWPLRQTAGRQGRRPGGVLERLPSGVGRRRILRGADVPYGCHGDVEQLRFCVCVMTSLFNYTYKGKR